jgi:hypothetical protein
VYSSTLAASALCAVLEKEPGPLYDWIRDVWHSDYDVGVYTLQEGILTRLLKNSIFVDQSYFPVNAINEL